MRYVIAPSATETRIWPSHSGDSNWNAMIVALWLYRRMSTSSICVSVLDIFSSCIVGWWEVHEEENAAHAKELITKPYLRQALWRNEKPLVLHSDNGSPMKASTFRATLERLGISGSYSRPRTSDDNAYSESLFRTLKYRPEYPTYGFESLEATREWTYGFVHWYNEIPRIYCIIETAEVAK
ncbi:MAG: transposase [Verrucomicrobiae bacterium]|nr:transposase [Verrucomicrobiae bacterium]